MEDAAHRTIYFMRRLIGVATVDFGGQQDGLSAAEVNVGRRECPRVIGTMNDPCVSRAPRLAARVQRFRDVANLHRRAELPGDDVTREVIQDCAAIEPAPSRSP